MPVFLKSIEIENFKSFEGNLVVGPLRAFTAVIGPNGTGKSNLMDAICFVMGEKTSCLRVNRLDELAHHSLKCQGVEGSVSVTAVFQLEDGTEKRFMRSLRGYRSEHHIDDEDVSSKVYLAELKRLKMNVKAKNFLIFQGAIESVATQTSKERTALFEEISNSGALKAEYDRLKSEKLQAEEKTKSVFLDGKEVKAEEKRFKAIKKEIERRDILIGVCDEKQIELQLLRLYYNHKGTESLEKMLVKKQRQIDRAIDVKEQGEDMLRDRITEFDQLVPELRQIDSEVNEMETQMSKITAAATKATENVAHMRRKVEVSQKNFTVAQNAEEAHKRDVEHLEEELEKVRKAMEDYESTVAGLSQSQGRDVQLEEEQVEEYNRLKEAAAKQAESYQRNLHEIVNKQKAEQCKLDNETRKTTNVENKYNRTKQQHDEAQKRAEKLKERIDAAQTELEDKKRVKSELQSDLETARVETAKLESELTNVCEQLGPVDVDQREMYRIQKKAEVVENLQRLSAGVFDRMVNECQPIHQRYNVAITKVLGKYMEAIVVDTEKTARQCIRYLKEQKLEPETFLPLDYIKVKELSQRYRDIQEAVGATLLYDVIKYDPVEISQAVLFATNNALVCETPEDARRVAYSSDKRARFNCVALDGTYYQKHGIISGGAADLQRRARRWDQNSRQSLIARKEKLVEDLRKASKKSRKECDLNAVNVEIKGLETRLEYMNQDLEKTEKEIASFKNELEKFEKELKSLEPKLNAIKSTMAATNEQIENIKRNINSSEDEVFLSFCSQIGVNNIREYEERDLRLHQEREKERLKFNDQIDRIENQLVFERDRDNEITGNVSRWRDSLKAAENRLEIAERTEARRLAKKEQLSTNMNVLLDAQTRKREEANQKEEVIGMIRRDVGVIARRILASQGQLNSIKAKIDQNKADRHTILMQCKIEDISIPLLAGNIEDIAQGSAADSETASETSSANRQYERDSLINVDFRYLRGELKELVDDGVGKTIDDMNAAIKDLQNTINELQSSKLSESLLVRTAGEQGRNAGAELEALRNKAKILDAKFQKVKRERHVRFTTCFEHVTNVIDEVYKTLSKDESAQAFLEPRNPEEPYLDGIDYNCVAPGKRYQPMSVLSGGEKTIAALALLFAIHSFQQAPLFVLDEIDAALDNTNMKKVAGYLRGKTDSLQTFVISLKDTFFTNADSLIGMTAPVHSEYLSSKVTTLDLSAYIFSEQ